MSTCWCSRIVGVARLLFESGDYFVQHFRRCGDYSRVAATNRERRLIERIRYIVHRHSHIRPFLLGAYIYIVALHQLLSLFTPPQRVVCAYPRVVGGASFPIVLEEGKGREGPVCCLTLSMVVGKVALLYSCSCINIGNFMSRPNAVLLAAV